MYCPTRLDLEAVILPWYSQKLFSIMKAFIKNSKAISPQQSFYFSLLWKDIIPAARYMSAIEPNYKDYFPAMKLRRMSRIVKMGLISATECLKEPGLEQPGAIITATGWGCLADTYKFLDEITEKNEQTLSPATFIQSTHNTVGGQIALMLDCQEYNTVYVNHTSSFEHGLLDALMLLKEHTKNVLIGGVDELTEIDFGLKEQMNFWKPENEISFLPDSQTSGTIAGEGSVFFLLDNKKNDGCFSQVNGVRIESGINANEILDGLLNEQGIKKSDIQVCITGMNGDKKLNEVYKNFLAENLDSSVNCYYKHLCGQYDTSSAFALWLANEIMKNQKVPDIIKVRSTDKLNFGIQNILIYHYSESNEHAFILVSKANI
jgi:3-oxoacyl-[acyl-carrier-protein] synthase II